MQVDYSVELGPDDETLEFPWSTPGDGPRYFDLKQDPDALRNLEEAEREPELRDFLAKVNGPGSILESAKCDVWSSTEIHPEEEILGLPWKFGSYVDVVFSSAAERFSFESHESVLKKLCDLLKRAPEIPASAEFLLRHCNFHERDGLQTGFYVTFYLFGFGEDEEAAHRQWGIALRLVGNAIRQVGVGR